MQVAAFRVTFVLSSLSEFEECVSPLLWKISWHFCLSLTYQSLTGPYLLLGCW